MAGAPPADDGELPLEGARDHLDQFLVGSLDAELVCTAGLEILRLGA